jgi:hypothetical protein
MKKHFPILLAIIVIFMFTFFVSQSWAAGEKVSGTISNMVVKQDKNGNEYVRFIVPLTLNLNGISYEDALPFMAFGAQVEEGKTYKEGDVLTVIAKSREFQGRQSYTILKYVK